MMQTIRDKSVQGLETIVERLENFEQLQKRPRVFAKEPAALSDDDQDSDGASSHHSSNRDDGAADHSSEKLKQLSFELIDIGIHTSQLGLELVQQTETYQ